MRIAIASSTVVTDDWPDDRILAGELTSRGCEATVEDWDADIDWDAFDLVVVRSTWDYTWRRDEFIAWARRIGPRLRNETALIEWNSDKRYLAEMADAGLAVVSTEFCGPGDSLPELDGEVVVKPVISAGARDTGRFGPATHDVARELIDRIRSGGGTAMIQPYLPDADVGGETAIVFIAGEVRGVLHKKAVLAPDEVAPLREGDLSAAEAMFDPELVTAAAASDDQLAKARRVIAFLTERFGSAPLYARVDMLRSDDGAPILLELEAVEPNLYFGTTPGVVERLAEAIVAEVTD